MSSILQDLVKSRRARARMGTNPDQFEAIGEPWRMPIEERATVQVLTRSRKIRKAQPLKPKAEKIFRENPRAYPAPSSEVLQARERYECLKIALAAGTGNNSRTLKSESTPDEREHFRRVLAPVGVVQSKEVDLGKVAPDALAKFIAKERAEMVAQRAKRAGR